MVFGTTGSGKTSGSARQIAKSFLKAGMGGLVLCVKEDEARNWLRLATDTGRIHDVIRIAPNEANTFNFLDYQRQFSQNSVQSLTDNVADLLLEVLTLLDRGDGAGGGSQDPFWDRTRLQMLKNAMVLQREAFGEITISGLLRIINSAPRDFRNAGIAQDDLRTDPKTAEFSAILSKADRSCSPNNREELELAKVFFLNEFARLAEKTRSIVVTSFSSMADSLLRPPLNRLLCQKTTIAPEAAFDGKIIVVDLPVHVFRYNGKIANVVWKIAFKRACEARTDPMRPVFLWADECQYLLDKADAAFSTTARSTKCCIVAATQNLPILYEQMGGPKSESVKALLGCLHTKIFHQNDDPETNNFAAEVIQKILKETTSVSQQSNGFFSSSPKTTGKSLHWDFDVPQRAFTLLRSGGVADRGIVEAVVYESGRQFSNRKPWLKVTFNQKTDSIGR